MTNAAKKQAKPDLGKIAEAMDAKNKASVKTERKTVPPKELIVIDELRDLLDNLRETEFAELKKSIEAEGIRDPIVVWKEKSAIVDGYNRHRIAILLNKDVPVAERSFKDIAEVKQWMLRNQLGRRNLTKDRFDYYIGKLYNEIKQTGQKTDQGGQATAATIGQQFGVSERTVRRAGDTARGLDKLEQVRGKLAKINQLDGKGDFTKSEVTTIGKASNAAVAARVVKKLEDNKKVENAKKQAAKDAAKQTDTLYGVAFVEPDFDAIGFNISTEPRPPLDKDAIVYMAVADEHMGQALKLLDKWGLDYECSFVFKLKNSYEGVWSKVQHTFLIVGTKGTMTGPKVGSEQASMLDGNSEPTEKMAKLIETYHNGAKKLAIMGKSRAPNGWMTLPKK